MKTEIEQLRKEFNERIDALLKEETKLEIGKWYKSHGGGFLFLTKEYSNGVCGYGITGSGNWTNEWYCYPSIDRLRPATDKEVEDALINEAKKRGFKEGVRFRCLEEGKVRDFLPYDDRCKREWKDGLPVMNFYSGDNHLFINSGLYNRNGGCSNPSIFRDGKWAEIIKEEKIEVGGYEVKKTDSSNFQIGCKTILREEMNSLQRVMIRNGFKNVTFDGTKVTLETINKITNL